MRAIGRYIYLLPNPYWPADIVLAPTDDSSATHVTSTKLEYCLGAIAIMELHAENVSLNALLFIKSKTSAFRNEHRQWDC